MENTTALELATGRRVRFKPALNVTCEEISQMIEALAAILIEAGAARLVA